MTLADFSLSRGQRRTLGQLAHVVCPGDVAALGIETAIVDEFELLLRTFPPLVRFAMLAATVLMEWLAVLAPSSLLRPFSLLPRGKQQRWFARWAHCPLMPVRQLAKTMKGLLGLGYWEHPSVKERIGYHPERWIAQVKEERAARFADEIAAGEAAVVAPDPLVPAATLARRRP